MHGLVAEPECAVVHGHKALGAEFGEGLDGFLGVHVHFAPARRVVGADGQERDVDVVALADFFEAIEICGVATVENGAVVDLDDKASKAAMGIVEHAGAPMMAGGERYFERAEFVMLPIVEFVDALKAEVVHEVADFKGDDDGLVGCDFPQCGPVEMIEVGVGDQDGVDGREVVDVQARMAHAFDDLEPLGPVGVDEHAVTARLNEKRGVPDPGDPDFAFLEFRKRGRGLLAGAFGEKRGDEDLGEEVALMPVGFGLESYVVRGG